MMRRNVGTENFFKLVKNQIRITLKSTYENIRRWPVPLPHEFSKTLNEFIYFLILFCWRKLKRTGHPQLFRSESNILFLLKKTDIESFSSRTKKLLIYYFICFFTRMPRLILPINTKKRTGKKKQELAFEAVRYDFQ